MENYSWLNVFNLSDAILGVMKNDCYVSRQQPDNYETLLNPSEAGINTYTLDSENGLIHTRLYYILISGKPEMIGIVMAEGSQE